MILFYIAPRQLVLDNCHRLPSGLHMVHADEDAGTVVVKINMKDEITEEWWCSQPGVEPLPHPIIDHGKPVKDEHADKLKKFGVKKGHTIHDVIEKIAAHHTGKAFRTRVF